MGPNGSGKSTLAQVLAGRDDYEVTEGEVLYDGKDLLDMEPEERAREGVFLAFQYPVEIPGVSNTYFLQAALNAIRKHRGQEELDAMEFLELVQEKMKLLEMDEALLNRPVNEGFSGGEKKRNEIFQMAVLEPKLAILDETDSASTSTRCKIVADGVNALRSPERAMLVVTHYQRLLNYIVPDFVHVLVDGRIVQSGGKELALELEEKGYGWLESRRRRGLSIDRHADRVDDACDAYVAAFERARAAAPARAGVADARRAAARSTAFARSGFPTTRDEDWRFTNVAPIAETAVRARRRRRPRVDRDARLAALTVPGARRARARVRQRPLRAGAVDAGRAAGGRRASASLAAALGADPARRRAAPRRAARPFDDAGRSPR